jgi:hypothetical protein
MEGFIMTATATVLSNKASIIKEREGERLARYLRVLFGNQKFGFKWSHRHTSYTDGKDVYILYELQTPQHRPFTAAELRVLRKGHSIHERGHIEYDVIQHYVEWQEEWVSNVKAEWIANEKYPLPWVQFFGNVMMDGRMENFTVLDHPTTQEYIDFGNYEWRFGIRGQHAGENPVADFRECFMHRALGMTDLSVWLPESVELVDSIQSLIEKGREDKSTKEVLETTTEMMKLVWPTLVEWLGIQNEEPDSFDYQDDHQQSEWGTPEEVQENIERVLRALFKIKAKGKKTDKESDETSSSDKQESDGSDHEPTDELETDNDDSENVIEEENTEEEEGVDSDSHPDFSNAIRLEERQLEKDEKATEEQMAPYQTRSQQVTIHEHREDREAYSDNLIITPYEYTNKGEYDKLVRSIMPHINPTAKALAGLLEGIPDEDRRNQRSGRVLASRAWRADKLADVNVFEKRSKGTPGKNARVLVLNDCSGSTGSRYPDTNHRIIDEMKKAQVLLIEACEKANLPVATYAFTEHYSKGNLIFPLKPYGRLTDVERGFVGGLDAESGNRDTVSLQWAVDELNQYNEDVRVVLMISDGEPCFEHGEDYDTMRSIVQQAEKKGIEILCLYVGPQNVRTIERVRHMYPGRSIIVSHDLARELTRHVKRIIRQKK